MRRASPPVRGATQISLPYSKAMLVAFMVGFRNRRVPPPLGSPMLAFTADWAFTVVVARSAQTNVLMVLRTIDGQGRMGVSCNLVCRLEVAAGENRQDGRRSLSLAFGAR